MQIYWTYRMAFPLFQAYTDYTYYSSTPSKFNQRRIVRSAYDDHLVILMSNRETEPAAEVKFQLFFY